MAAMKEVNARKPFLTHLTVAQYEALREAAFHDRVPITELVRQSVEMYLASREGGSRAAARGQRRGQSEKGSRVHAHG